MISRVILEKIYKNFVRDITSFGGLGVILLLPFLFAIDTLLVFSLYFVLFVIEVVVSIIKVVLYKTRPEREKYKNVVEKVFSGSFPSAHVARSTYLLMSIYYIQGASNYFFLFMVVLVGLSRVLLRKHFEVDVIVGVIIALFAVYLSLYFNIY